jgi:hypothetical protein
VATNIHLDQIRVNIGRNIVWYEMDAMIMDTMGRENFLGSGKNNLVSREDIFEVGMHRGWLNDLNGVE